MSVMEPGMLTEEEIEAIEAYDNAMYRTKRKYLGQIHGVTFAVLRSGGT